MYEEDVQSYSRIIIWYNMVRLHKRNEWHEDKSENKKAKKSTRILAFIALIGLFVTDMIGNLYLSAGAVLFALALIAAVITDMVGSFIKSWRENRE